MEEEYLTEEQPSKKNGCLVAGWIAFIFFVAILGLFSYRVWDSYQKIVKGEEVILPQFRGSLTTENGRTGVNNASEGDRRILEGGEHPTLGTDHKKAKLTIVEFADFQCPFSKKAHSIVRRLMMEYGDSVHFIYRDYPITSIHNDAYSASLAAECAQEQNRFWAYHDKLYANSPTLGFQDLVRYAEETGLDKREFEECLIAQKTKDNVDDDVAFAKEGGVRGTPTFFFNGYRVEGAIPEAEFRRLIDRFLKSDVQ